MKLHTVLLVGFALTFTACAKKEQAVPEEEAAPPVVEAAPVEKPEWQNDAFLEHMHRHADYLDDMNIALADEDLQGAMTPAYWLANHDSVSGVPDEWQQYLDGMRAGARAVEAATDLETARPAAESITQNCQGCHIAAGIVDE